jgi:spore maturation protein CgeB
MHEHFKDDESIAFYQTGKWHKVNQSINDYLANPLKMKKIVKKGYDIVSANHTWDQRAETLLKELPQVLKRIKTRGEG